MTTENNSITNTSNASSMTPARLSPKLDNRDLTKSSFWISQVFMIVATIIGVFLAAQQGLSQAILFDTLNSKENNFYLRHSLDNEITVNLATLREYADLVEENKTYDLKSQHPALLDFVWENMKYSSSTLETPSHILSKASQFYLQANMIVNKIENRKYGAKFGANKLRELITDIENTGLKSLRENHQRLAKELAESNIIVMTE
jgi:hypothetical protein